MKGKKHRAEQIIRMLREADAMLASGKTIGQACQALEVSEQTFHRWRNQYGDIPQDRGTREWAEGWDEQAWMIEGQPWGEQPRHKPVSVPPINEILERTVFGRGAIIPVRGATDLEPIQILNT